MVDFRRFWPFFGDFYDFFGRFWIKLEVVVKNPLLY